MRHRKKSFGIRGGIETGLEDGVIAGRFLFAAHSCGQRPDQGVKPVNGAREVRDEVRLKIPAFDMGIFVTDGRLPLPIRPFVGLAWQRDLWPEESRCERHAYAGVADHTR